MGGSSQVLADLSLVVVSTADAVEASGVLAQLGESELLVREVAFVGEPSAGFRR
jgi:hypothetical protein